MQLGAGEHESIVVTRRSTWLLHARLICAKWPCSWLSDESYGVYSERLVTRRSKYCCAPLGSVKVPTLTKRMPCTPVDAPSGVSGPIPPRLL